MSKNSSNFCTECQRPTIDIDAHRDIFHVNWSEILQNDPWPEVENDATDAVVPASGPHEVAEGPLDESNSPDGQSSRPASDTTEPMEMNDNLSQELNVPDPSSTDLAYQIQNLRQRFCPICCVRFNQPRDLDVHKFQSHRNIYFNRDGTPIQQGAGDETADDASMETSETSHEADPSGGSTDGSGNASSIRFVLSQEAFQTAREYELDFAGTQFLDVVGMFHTIRRQLGNLMLENLRAMRALSIMAEVEALFYHPFKNIHHNFYLHSFLHRVLDSSMIQVIIDLMAQKILDAVLTLTVRSSNWVLKQIDKFKISIIPYDPINGGTSFKLPVGLKGKKCTVSVDNQGDHMCFIWSLCAGLNPLYRSASKRVREKAKRKCSYTEQVKTLNYSGIKFPMTVKQIPKFMRQNPNISVNVLGYEESGPLYKTKNGVERKKADIYPLYVCPQVRTHHMDLLLVTVEDQSHFVLLKQTETDNQSGLTALLGESGKQRRLRCYYCLSAFTCERTRDSHVKDCSLHKPSRVVFPLEENFKFRSFGKTLAPKYWGCFDFESVLKPVMRQDCPDAANCNDSSCQLDHPESTMQLTEHIASGFCFVIIDQHGKVVVKCTYRGEDAAKVFVERLIEQTKPLFSEMQTLLEKNKTIKLTSEMRRKRDSATECGLCKKPFFFDETRHLHHNHYDGSVIHYATHAYCNKAAAIRKLEIPLYAHNFSKYDSHYVMEGAAQVKLKDMSAIALTREQFMSITLQTEDDFYLKLNDSYRLLPAGLDKLVDTARKSGDNVFNITRQLFPNVKDEHMPLLYSKGCFCYEYMSDFGKFQETVLPEKSYFYSSLKQKGVSDSEYEKATKIWDAFDCKNLGDFQDIYVTSDVGLTCDVLVVLRNLIEGHFGLQIFNYVSLPGISLDAALKFSDASFEHLGSSEKYLFFESMIRGGISITPERELNANNPYMSEYDPLKPNSYMIYMDFLNLYGAALRRYLPVRAFTFIDDHPLLYKAPEDFEKWVMQLDPEGEYGYAFEIDTFIPDELHDKLDVFPPFPTRMKMGYEHMSEHSRQLAQDYCLDPKSLNHEKLVITLEKKQNYRIHYRVLQIYLSLGARISKVHRIMRFKQQPIFKEFIDLCARMRANQLNTEFERSLWKFLVCSLYGKLLENKRNHKNVRFALTEKKCKLWASKPTMEAFQLLFGGKLAVFFMKKLSICLDRLPAAGTCVLDDSKEYLFDYIYNYLLKRYERNNVKIGMVDTDSCLSLVQTEDAYRDMREAFDKGDKRFELSVYEKLKDPVRRSWLFSDEVRGKLGTIKDEYPNMILTKAIMLAPKLYALKGEEIVYDESAASNSAEKTICIKAKGVNRASQEEHLRFALFEQVLQDLKPVYVPSMSFRSYGHKMYTVNQTKKALSLLDFKRYWSCRYTSLSFGHHQLKEFM